MNDTNGGRLSTDHKLVEVFGDKGWTGPYYCLRIVPMAGTNAIQWTVVTSNPVTGSDRVGPVVDNCCAPRMTGQSNRTGQPRYQVNRDQGTSGPNFGAQIHPDLIDRPRHQRHPGTMSVNSRPEPPRAPILTKRSIRLCRLLPQLPWSSNVWKRIEIDEQYVADRADDPRTVPTATLLISAEPLLGPVMLGLAGPTVGHLPDGRMCSGGGVAGRGASAASAGGSTPALATTTTTGSR